MQQITPRENSICMAWHIVPLIQHLVTHKKPLLPLLVPVLVVPT